MRQIRKYFPVAGGWFKPKLYVRAVDGVSLTLRRGEVFGLAGRSSPYSLYQHDLATYDTGDRFDHRASEGFIHIYGLAGRTQARVQPLELPDLSGE